jgi:hypothetical protein
MVDFLKIKYISIYVDRLMELQRYNDFKAALIQKKLQQAKEKKKQPSPSPIKEGGGGGIRGMQGEVRGGDSGDDEDSKDDDSGEHDSEHDEEVLELRKIK